MSIIKTSYEALSWSHPWNTKVQGNGVLWLPEKKYIRYISIICFSNKYSVPVTQSELCSIPGVAYTNEIVKRVLSYDQSIQGNLPVMFGPDIHFNHIFDLKSEVIAAFRVYTKGVMAW